MGRGAENGGAENSRISSGMGTWPLPPADSTMMLHPPRRARVGQPRFLPGGGVFRGAERGGDRHLRVFLPFGPTNPSPPRPPTPTFGVNSQGQEEGTREHSTPGGAPHGRKLLPRHPSRGGGSGGHFWVKYTKIQENLWEPFGGGVHPTPFYLGHQPLKKKHLTLPLQLRPLPTHHVRRCGRGTAP